MATTSYYLYDGIGSTVALTDSSHAVTETYRYEAFGTERGPVFHTTINAYRYVGQLGYYYDEETQDYYIRARHYDTRLARFISRDAPFTVPYYQYALNYPLAFADPSGEMPIAIPPDNIEDPVDPIPDQPFGKEGTEMVQQVPQWTPFGTTPACCGVEFGPYLRAIRSKLSDAFYATPVARRQRICLTKGLNWDIHLLYLAGGGGRNFNPFGSAPPYMNPFKFDNCGQPPCEGTVTIFGNCYWANEVNYYLLGAISRLCADDVWRYDYGLRWFGLKSLDGHLTASASLMVADIYRWKLGYIRRVFETQADYRRPGIQAGTSADWALAGFHNDIDLAAGTQINSQCPPCPVSLGFAAAATVGLPGLQIIVSVGPADAKPYVKP